MGMWTTSVNGIQQGISHFDLNASDESTEAHRRVNERIVQHRILPQWLIECALPPPQQRELSPEEVFTEQMEELKALLEEDGLENDFDMDELRFDLGFDCESATRALQTLLGEHYATMLLSNAGLKNKALFSIIDHGLKMRQLFRMQDC